MPRRRRVNTRFVIGLIACVVILAGGLAATYAFFSGNDPNEHIARGEELYQQGEYRRAAEQFGRALRDRKQDVDLILRYVDCVRHYEVTTAKAAAEHVRQIQGLLSNATEIEPDNPEPFEQLMKLLMVFGREMGEFGAWDRMYERASGTLSVRPDMMLARKYRGIAVVQRMAVLDTRENELEQAAEDLRAVLREDPTDQEATYHLALWHIERARQLSKDGRGFDVTDPLRAEAKRLTGQAMDRQSTDQMQARIDHLDILLRLEDYDDAARVVNALEEVLLHEKLDRPDVAVDVARALPMVDRGAPKAGAGPAAVQNNPGLRRAAELLAAMREQSPNDLELLVTLGRVLAMQDRRDEALKIFDEARQTKLAGPPIQVARTADLQLMAKLQYADLLLSDIDKLESAKRDELIADAGKIIEQLKTLAPNNPTVVLLEGKVKLAQNEWSQASALLDRANSMFNNANPEALLLSARARASLGELGASAERLERVLQVQPTYLPARYELAATRLKLHQVRDAQAQVDAILEERPGDVGAYQLQALIYAQSEQLDKAIDIYQRLDPIKNPQFLVPLAQLMRQAGRSDEARPLLEQRFEASPTDPMILQQLLAVAPDRARGLDYIRRAREAGGDEKLLALLEQQFADPEGLRQFIQDLITREEKDPFSKHMQLYQLALRTGDSGTAERHLAEAARLKPDHPFVVGAQFDWALAKGDYDRAEALARRAGQLNLDSAKGHFFRARIAMHRKDFERAEAIFKLGLRDRPVFSDGWRQLGDAQRESGNLTEAARSYDQALQQRPDNVAALRGLAAVQAGQLKTNDALATLRRALEIVPNDHTLRNQYLQFEALYGDVQRALRGRLEFASKLPSDRDNRRALAQLLMRVGEREQALQRIDALIAEEGQTPANLSTKASLLAQAGRASEGQELLQTYIRSRGEQVAADDWSLLARYLVSIGQVEPAYAAFRQAIEIEDRVLRPATRELADLMFDRGQFDDALAYYRELWKADNSDFRVGHRLAENLLRIGEIDEAEELLDAVTRSGGANFSSYVLQHLIARHRSKPGQALEAINKAIEIEPRRGMGYHYRAELLAADHTRQREVLADLNRALELEPTLLPPRHLLATIHLQNKRAAEAVVELEQALKYVERDRQTRLRLAGLYFELDRKTALRTLLDESRKLFPEDAAWVMLQARLAGQEKNLKRRSDLLREALALVPAPQTLYELADTLLQLNQPDAALAALREHPVLIEREALLQAVRARALNQAGRAGEAVGAFKQAIEQAQNSTQLSSVTREMVRTLGREETASHLRALLAGDRLALAQLAMVQLDIESGDYDGAAASLKETASLVKADSPVALGYDQLLALVAHQRGDHETAYDAYRRVVEVSKNDARSLNNLAYLLANELDRPKDALPYARRAAELLPNDAQILDTLGWTQFKLNQVEEARLTLERSYELERLPHNALHLGEVYLVEGKRPNAAEMFQSALDAAGDQTEEAITMQARRRLRELGRL